MSFACQLTRAVNGKLDQAGAWLGLLALRLLLAWEFGVSGLEKFHGENWFAEAQSQFIFPFSMLPVDLNWFLATWFELIGAAALVLGLATRFFAASLAILTIVAIGAVHAGLGYNVCDNGWKLPLMYLVMFVPLILSGAGKLSLDHWFANRPACRTAT